MARSAEDRIVSWLIRVNGYEAAYLKAFERAHRLEHFGKDWGDRNRSFWRPIWARICRKIKDRYHRRTMPTAAPRRMRPINVRPTY